MSKFELVFNSFDMQSGYSLHSVTFSLLVFCCFVAQLLSESSCSVNEDTKMLHEKLEFTFNKMLSLKLRTYNLLMRLTYMDKSDRGKKDAIIFN